MEFLTIDAGMVAVIVIVLFALLGLAVGYGALLQKVKNNKEDIEKFCRENREDHRDIFNKLDAVLKAVNGKKKGNYEQG